MPQSIVQIALNSPLRSLFDYKSGGLALEPGQRVEIPFGKRRTTGMVVNCTSTSTLEDSQLKSIHRCIDEHPSISEKLLRFILWAANYYQHPVGEALFHALPVRLRENQSIEHKDFQLWKPTEKGRLVDADKLQRAPKQMEALNILQKHPEGIGPKTCQALKLSNATFRALEQKGLAIQESQNPSRQSHHTHLLRTSPLKLTQEQEVALATILSAKDAFSCFLLQGVTGSGKTEVYLQAIEKCLEQGKQALVLVPEIGLTPQTLQRFQQRFSCEIVALHSGLTDSQRFKAWYKAKQGQAAIVIGTRSAIFTELPHLGIIIVDEEHDLSYKQQEGFRYSARDLAVLRAQSWKVPIILGSATPSLESLHNCENGRYQLIELKQRTHQHPAPSIQLLDVNNTELQGGLSHKLIQKVRAHLEQKNQVLVFINRRGYSPALICSQCLWLATCPYCDARFTYHKGKGRLLCHHCNYQQPPMHTCPQCHEGEMHALGQGTEKVEEILSMHFRKIPVIRIDRDSTEKKHQLQKQLDIIQQGEPCILVGTQMLSKGHHFPKLTLVCIIDADQGFFSADFRSMERMGQTLVQISGRAGRESSSSEALLQTELPDHPALLTLVKQGYPEFARQLLADRQALNFPPYGYLCLIRADAPHIETSLDFLAELKKLLEEHASKQLSIMGPAPSNMQKKAGRHRAQLLLKADKRSDIQNTLSRHIASFAQLPSARKVRWSLDVDPQDLF